MKYYILKLYIAFNLLVICLFSTNVYSHPVSFQDGTMITGSYMKGWMEHDANYTFSKSSSVGITQFRIEDDGQDKDYVLSRLAHRIRWNTLTSQANVYGTVGLGARVDKGKEAPVGLLSLQADYETRRIYTLGLVESLVEADEDPISRAQYRLGFSPYKTGFDGISTWIIGQVDYMPNLSSDELMFSPVLRIFWHNILLEGGVSMKGDVFMTWMYSF